MPFPLAIPLALGAASFFGGMFGKGGKKTSTTMPQLDPAYSGLQSALLPMITKRLQQSSALPAGYGEARTSEINQGYRSARTALANRLAARGLSSSPVAGSGEAVLEGQRFGDITRMKQTLPLIDRQFQQEDLASALELLQLGRGSTTTETGGGSRLGGGLSGLASMLGFLYGQGAFGNGGGSGGGRLPMYPPVSPG